MGRWLFTGSQEAPLMRGVTESMAGRAAILQLMPFSLAETNRVSLLHGGYPEVLAHPKARDLWFSSYIQTYLERDVRGIVNIRDLGAFRRFLALLASRHGQILNRTDLAAPLGISVPTVSDWLHVLELTGQIVLVSPYFENFGKRLIKSPKVYLGDSGMACHLLGIRSQAELDRSPFLGALFEGFVAAEILKSQANRGSRKELYYFRDQQGLEVDFLFPGGRGGLWMVECKASKTVQPAMAGPMNALRRSMREGAAARMSVVHRPSSAAPRSRALAPGVEALDVAAFVEELGKGARGMV
jgi:predicted AAA+ superfamily ATPase